MKWICITVAMVWALAGCSKSVNEASYLGKWTQLHTNGVATMVVDIEKSDTGYTVKISVPVPNQPPAVINKSGKFENGEMKIEGFEKIYFKEDGHLMIGVNEFERTR